MKMSMVQDTDTKNKNKSFFQLDIPETMSITEAGNLKALVFRNDSASNGDLYLEGTIKQIKSFLKNYVVVKPACMLDNHIKVDFTIKYSRNGRYNDKYVREVTQNLT